MTTFTTKDGVNIYYKDWGIGLPVVFSHGWPLDADAWDAQMFFLLQHGYRVIAHDRRGHGRSEQPTAGHEMDTYADDLATLIELLDLKEATLVGHSTGGGEVARYIGRHGTKRIVKVVLIGAVPPQMVKTPANPRGVNPAVFDNIRQQTTSHRSQFFKDLAMPFYGYNRPGIQIEQGVIDSFWAIGMLGAINAQYECIKAFSETDFTEDLKKFNVPTMFIHGDDDQIVPIGDSSVIAHKLVKNSFLKIYPGGPHGLCTTLAEQVNADVLSFLSD